MSLQTIVDNATYITVDKKKVASQSVSRSGVVMTAERTSVVPYRFIVGMHDGLTYSTNRGLLEDIDALDITTEATIDIGDTNTNLSYVTAYQGGSTGTMTAVGSDAKELYVNSSLMSGGGNGFLFKKGDFLQPVGNTGTYRYPYQVTADVSHSSSSNVTIPVHRPVISQDGVALTSGTVNRGVDVRFKVKMLLKPSYSVVPHDRLSFSDDFELIEIITT
jgi:hypothetical protein